MTHIIHILTTAILFLSILNPSKLAAQEVIKIGFVLPLTGEYSEDSNENINFAKLAAHLKDHKIEVKLIFEDDQFNSTKGLAAIKKLLNYDKVNALVNFSTPTMNVVENLIIKQGLPTIQVGIVKNSKPDNIFLIQPTPLVPFQNVLEVLSKRDYHKVFMFYFDDPAVDQMNKIVENQFKKQLTSSAVPNGETMMSALVIRALKQNPNLIILNTSINQSTLLTKELIKANYRGQIFNVFGFQGNLEKFKEIIGNLQIIKDAEGMSYFARLRPPIVAKYMSVYQDRPNDNTGLAYDAIKVLVETYNKDQKQWVQNIAKYSGLGANEKISFDSDGNRLASAGKIMTLEDVAKADGFDLERN